MPRGSFARVRRSSTPVPQLYSKQFSHRPNTGVRATSLNTVVFGSEVLDQDVRLPESVIFAWVFGGRPGSGHGIIFSVKAFSSSDDPPDGVRSSTSMNSSVKFSASKALMDSVVR